MASFWLAFPEKAPSKKYSLPSAIALGLSRHSLERSGGGSSGFASAARRSHSPGFQSHPADAQKTLSANLPHPANASSKRPMGIGLAIIDAASVKIDNALLSIR